MLGRAGKEARPVNRSGRGPKSRDGAARLAFMDVPGWAPEEEDEQGGKDSAAVSDSGGEAIDDVPFPVYCCVERERTMGYPMCLNRGTDSGFGLISTSRRRDLYSDQAKN